MTTILAVAYAAGLSGYPDGDTVVLRLRAWDRVPYRSRTDDEAICLLVGFLCDVQAISWGQA